MSTDQDAEARALQEQQDAALAAQLAAEDGDAYDPGVPSLDGTAYDLVVFGTGCTESMVAAAAARAGYSVLHMDRNPFYGDSLATMKLSEMRTYIDSVAGDALTPLHEASADADSIEPSPLTLNVAHASATIYNGKQRDVPRITRHVVPAVDEEGNESFIEYEEEQRVDSLLAYDRKFALDLVSKITLSRDSMISLLISSGTSRYFEFKIIEDSYMHHDARIQQVPASKSDVFNSAFKNLDKRRLMKFLHFCMEYATDDQALAELDEFRDAPFSAFLDHRGLSPSLQQFVLHAIAGLDAPQHDGMPKHQRVTTEQGLARMALYLQSLGRYGKTAYLYTLYGTSEYSQGFCRVSAVYNGVYMLNEHQPTHLLLDDATGNVDTIVCQGMTVSTRRLVTSPDYVPAFLTSDIQQQRALAGVAHAVCIVDASLRAGAANLNLVIPPATVDNEYAIQVIQHNYEAMVCPEDVCIVYLSVRRADSHLDAQALLQPCVDLLFNTDPGRDGRASASSNDTPNADEDLMWTGDGAIEDDTKRPNLLWCAFFDRMQREIRPQEELPSNVRVCNDPSPGLAIDECVDEARAIFASLFPEDEFLPKIPNPEEVWAMQQLAAQEPESWEVEEAEVEHESDAEQPSSAYVFHICKKSDIDWSTNTYTAPSLNDVGFIHCTGEASLLLNVANLWMQGEQGDYVIMVIAVDRLESNCVWEEPTSNSNEDDETKITVLMPHVYGPINLDAVCGLLYCQRDDDGAFVGLGALDFVDDATSATWSLSALPNPDRDVRALAAALFRNDCPVTALHLAQTPLDDELVRLLACAIRDNADFTVLSLTECQISDDAATYLAETLAEGANGLTTLDLSNNSLTDACATPLGSFASAKSCEVVMNK